MTNDHFILVENMQAIDTNEKNEIQVMVCTHFLSDMGLLTLTALTQHY